MPKFIGLIFLGFSWWASMYYIMITLAEYRSDVDLQLRVVTIGMIGFITLIAQVGSYYLLK